MTVQLLPHVIHNGLTSQGEESMSRTIERAVREAYGAVAASSLSGDHAGVRAVAEAFGYSADELAGVPTEANMGLSCGNPTSTANLKPGEVVVDLGSGGGLDIFLAARKVGPTGKAIGIDMTPEMVDRARRNAAKQGLDNVEFHLAAIDRTPLADASVDCVISNCVINLAPEKAVVFREIHRILKPGGRVAVSDIALKMELPADLAANLAAYVGCVAGAIKLEDYIAGLETAGFSAVQVVDTKADLNAYANVEGQAGCCSPGATPPSGLPIADIGGGCSSAAPPALHEELADLIRRYDINEFAASVRIFAVKPTA